MARATKPARKIPITGISIGVLAIAALVAGLLYLNHPANSGSEGAEATAEAKAYLPNLALSDVNMQATENFMQQQVVEIQGKITNNGPRKLAIVDVYCLFAGADGAQIYRERLTIARGLAAHETRAFRLPFDTLPDGWNQAMPRMVIARIAFAS